MAKLEIVTSDIDGAHGASTRAYVVMGKTLSVDLTDAQAAEFDELIARFAAFVEAGRLKRVHVPKESQVNGHVPSDGPDV